MATTISVPVGASLPNLAVTRAYRAIVHLRGNIVDAAPTAASEFAAVSGSGHPFGQAGSASVIGRAHVATRVVR
ncbi:hypothetical protein ACWDUM_02600 [Rhodococcus sp. NPDC003322]